MSSAWELDDIRTFWRDQALQHGQSARASWSDQPIIELERKEIAARLRDGDRVLDVGCSNAHSTLEWAAQKRIEVRGLDYVPEMIAAAEERLAQSPDLSDRVEFAVGDVTALAEPDAAYDVVVSVRVLINLGSWDRQRTALQEYARVLKPGGRLILSEATLQGWNHLNDFRREWGLAPIPMPGFNHYLDRDNVAQALSPHLQLVERLNFSSTYYVATRLLKPLLIKAVDAPVDVADPLTHWNRWSALLPPLGDWGVQELFLFSKGGAI